jgi:hypothetical protein
MAQLIYIDETGSVGTAGSEQPYLTLVAVIVHEDKVRPLAEAMDEVAFKHLGWVPANFEFHGHELWGATGPWSGKTPPELLAAFEEAIALLDELDLSVVHATINKAALHDRYNGDADANAYRLALQLLLEKVDGVSRENKILVADEAKEQQLAAIGMVADMQKWGNGELPGKALRTVIDSLHFVRSHASPGVQLADLVAYVIQRARRPPEPHPDAQTTRDRLSNVVKERTRRWRDPWP